MIETYPSFLRPIKRCGSYLALSYINSDIIHSQKWKLLEMSHTEVRLTGACARESSLTCGQHRQRAGCLPAVAWLAAADMTT